MADEPHVVILGAGFAGLGAMRKLENAGVKLTLIDRNDYHSFQPLLYQVATDELAETEVGFPVRDMIHGHEKWQFNQAAVTGVDPANKTVTVEGMPPIPYDYLVIAVGAVVNFYGTKGAGEYAFPMYTLHDAVTLRQHVLEQFEAADRDPARVEDGALNFCVVGGGATGVETAGALAELIGADLKEDYPNLAVERAEVHLYEIGPHLLSPFKPKLQDYAQKALEERGVSVHLGEGVAEVEPTLVHLHSGGVVKAQTLIWGAGLTSNPVAGMLGVDLVKGRVPVTSELSLKDHPEVFAVGDIAMITDAKTNDQLPQLGSVAKQAGEHAGESIARLLKGEQPKPFEYTDKGTMATIGRGAAVVEFRRGRTMTGHAAWLAWLGVHLMLLSGGEEKTLTFLDWGWNIMANNRGKRIVVE
jgi:NADH:quinone reductase (non-electrogenic)